MCSSTALADASHSDHHMSVQSDEMPRFSRANHKPCRPAQSDPIVNLATHGTVESEGAEIFDRAVADGCRA